MPREPLTIADARRLLADASAGHDPTGWLEAAAPDLARLAIAESERADRAERERDEAIAALDAIPIDDLRCPVCGCTTKWSCGVDDHPTGWAHCEDGGQVSRRVNEERAVCGWRGTTVRRVAGRVFAFRPIRLEVLSG